MANVCARVYVEDSTITEVVADWDTDILVKYDDIVGRSCIAWVDREVICRLLGENASQKC